MTATKAFAYVYINPAVCGFIGGALGRFIGTAEPDYYRLLFHIADDRPFDPVQFGSLLGLAQGLGVGIAIGLVVVLALIWKESRHRIPEQPKSPSDT